MLSEKPNGFTSSTKYSYTYKNKKVVKEKVKYSDGSYDLIKYTYKNGLEKKMVLKNKTKKGKTKYTITATFTYKNKAIKKIVSKTTGEYKYTSTEEYYTSGKSKGRLKATSYDGSKFTFTYKYDDNGNMIEELEKDSTGKVTTKFELTYEKL